MTRVAASAQHEYLLLDLQEARAQGLAGIARHVNGYHSTQGTRVYDALHDKASNVCKDLA
jgi:hypothetical protein